VSRLVPEDLGTGLERVVRERRAGAGQRGVDADVDGACVDPRGAAAVRSAARDVAGRDRRAAAVRRAPVRGPTVRRRTCRTCSRDDGAGRTGHGTVRAGARAVRRAPRNNWGATVALRTDAGGLERSRGLRLEPAGGAEQR